MNVYDFDQTIYNPDSSYSFFLYCLKKYPSALLPTLPKTLIYCVRYGMKRIKTKELKQQLFSFLRSIQDIDSVVADFWDEHRGGIGQWYLNQKREDDVIISASPYFLLRPIAKELGVGLIATPMDKCTGEILGENCHDREKVRRFREQYPDAQPERFYSDSLSDTPMAELAEKAFLVCKGDLSPWPMKKAESG